MECLKDKHIIFKDHFKEFVKDSKLEKVHIVRAFTPELFLETTTIERANSSDKLNSEEEQAKLIWKRLKKGDIDALGELYDLYADELFAYGMEKVYNKTHVMDGIHDLFVDLYKYRSNLTVPANVKYYLLKSLRRKVYRKQTPKQNISIEDSFFENKMFSPALSYEEKVIEVERSMEEKDKLKTALTFLTTRQQKVLQLRYTENRTYTEIAEAMNISIATSRTLVYRALSVLRKHCLSLAIIVFNQLF